MATLTLKAPNTVQGVAKKYTGKEANSMQIMSINKLKSQNLSVGQKITIPDSLLLPEFKAKVESMRASASSSSKSTIMLLGLAAAIGGYMYFKKHKAA